MASFLIRGGTATALAGLVAVAAGFGIQVALARILDPSQLGAFFLTQSAVATAGIFAQLGLPRIILRELSSATGANE